jgi:hypothetical protein
VRRAAVPIAFSVVALAACGEKTINADNAARSVTDVVSRTGFKPTDMSCPTNVKAKTGGTFECHFTGPEGPYTAYVRITDVNGEDATFQITSRPSDRTPPASRRSD